MFILVSFAVIFTAETAEDAEKNPGEGKNPKTNYFFCVSHFSKD
jgi:hypothetical protein